MHILSATPRECVPQLRVFKRAAHLFSALKIAASTPWSAHRRRVDGSTTGIGALIISATYNFDSPLLLCDHRRRIDVRRPVLRRHHDRRAPSLEMARHPQPRHDPKSGYGFSEKRSCSTNEPRRRKGELTDHEPDFIEDPAAAFRCLRRGPCRGGRRSCGIAAAVAGARNGSRRAVERYPYLAGWASAGWCWCSTTCGNGAEIKRAWHLRELIDPLERLGLRSPRPPPIADPTGRCGANGHVGCFPTSPRTPSRSRSIIDGLRSGRLQARVERAHCRGQRLRYAAQLFQPRHRGGRADPRVICRSMEGRHAVLASVVVDATGDSMWPRPRGAPFVVGSYMSRRCFVSAGSTRPEAERFEYEEPCVQGARPRSQADSGRSWDSGGSRRRCPASCGATARTCPTTTASKSPTSARRFRRPQADRWPCLSTRARGCRVFRDCFIVDVAPQNWAFARPGCWMASTS